METLIAKLYNALLSLTIFLMYSSTSDASCSLPDELKSSTWEYNYTHVIDNSDQSATISIETNTMQTSVIYDVQGTKISRWTCINSLNISNTQDVVVFKSDSSVTIGGPFTPTRWLYICMKITKVTDDLFYFHLLSDVFTDVAPTERLFSPDGSAPNNNGPTCSTFCQYTSSPKIRTLRKLGTNDALPNDASLCEPCDSACDVAVTCDYPDTVPHTTNVTSGNGLDDTITLSCSVGYNKNSGDEVLTCKADGKWDGSPIICSPVTCPNPSAGVSATKLVQTGSNYLDTITYKCNTGYELSSGNLVRTCREGKLWDGIPPVCTKVTCQNPSAASFASLETQTGSKYLDTRTYKCNTGYELASGNLVLKCKEDKLWNGSPPVCIKVTCASPSSVAFATISSQTGSKYLDTIPYTCNTGYERTSSIIVRTCRANKTWNKSPLCSKVTCQNPSAASFASLETQTGSKYLDTRTYKCNTGYELASGNLVRKCKEDKQWDGNPPVCTKVTCQNPSAASFASLETQTGSKYLDTRTYKCNTGYELASGNLVRKCKEDKLWDGNPPVCTKVTCQNPSAASFASLETKTGSKYLDTLTYKCNTGYELASGNLVRKCKENKLWDGNPPVCTKVTCQNTWLVAFSTVSTTGNQYQDTVTYTCNTGYELTSGNLVRTCMENKNWSGNQPVCTITCPDPGESDHVTRQLNGNNPTETVVYKCDSGYDYFSGNTTRVCGSDGQWSGKKLVCRAYLAVSNEQSNYIIAATISGLLLILAIIVIFLFCYFIVRKKKN